MLIAPILDRRPSIVKVYHVASYSIPRVLEKNSGIQNFASNIAGIVLPIYTDFVVQATKGFFVIPLVTVGAFAIIGALSYLFIVWCVEPLNVKIA